MPVIFLAVAHNGNTEPSTLVWLRHHQNPLCPLLILLHQINFAACFWQQTAQHSSQKTYFPYFHSSAGHWFESWDRSRKPGHLDSWHRRSHGEVMPIFCLFHRSSIRRWQGFAPHSTHCKQIRQGKAQRRCHYILHYLLQLLLLQEGKQHSSTLKEERLSKANTNRSNPQTNKYLKG